MGNTYKIICRTDQYHAARNAGFNREGICVKESGLTLSQARAWMLENYNAYGFQRFNSWSLACAWSSKHQNDMRKACSINGLPMMNFSVFYWETIKETTEED